uniref:Secreted protein n=1 Tax=Anopheles darlingi TaxID=43151 RepID=A0A2M4D020_ANODA
MLLLLLLLLLLMLLRRVDGGCCRREHRNGKHTEARECACPLPDRAETQRRRSSANCASPTLFVFRVSHAAAILAYRRRWLTFLCSPTATFFARRLQSDHSFHLLPLPSLSLSLSLALSLLFGVFFTLQSSRSITVRFLLLGFVRIPTVRVTIFFCFSHLSLVASASLPRLLLRHTHWILGFFLF